MFGPGLSLALTPLLPQHSLRELCDSGQHEQGLAYSVASKWSDVEHESTLPAHLPYLLEVLTSVPRLVWVLWAAELLHALSVHILPGKRGQQ